MGLEFVQKSLGSIGEDLDAFRNAVSSVFKTAKKLFEGSLDSEVATQCCPSMLTPALC